MNSQKKAEALAYLHKRFPEVDDIELFELLEQTTSSISNILEAKLAYEACSNCDGTSCGLLKGSGEAITSSDLMNEPQTDTLYVSA